MVPDLWPRRGKPVSLIRELRAANFRCFQAQQRVPLAPVTLLVGENSTGKTSLLALVRVLWDMAIPNSVPDFKEPPYDLGSFDEIAHHRGGRGGRAEEFTAGFTVPKEKPWLSDDYDDQDIREESRARYYDATFRRHGPSAVAVEHTIRNERAELTAQTPVNGGLEVEFRLGEALWRNAFRRFASDSLGSVNQHGSRPWRFFRSLVELKMVAEGPAAESRQPMPRGLRDLHQLNLEVNRLYLPRPFASAPVRSQPRRTYDPATAILDPEGGHIPMFLADMARRNPEAWRNIRAGLERFGREAGLFDKIGIRNLGRGRSDSGPFQVEVRRPGKRNKGAMRNLIDMGYGVSQVLPVVTELLRTIQPQMFLIQQPEVHLHPSAQAALGSFFCQAAATGKQLLIETHSDHLIDRIRMEVRDGTAGLEPNDVSLLYFERNNLSVSIHALGWDQEGNLVSRDGGIPTGYRDFFRTERRRSLGL